MQIIHYTVEIDLILNFTSVFLLHYSIIVYSSCILHLQVQTSSPIICLFAYLAHMQLLILEKGFYKCLVTYRSVNWEGEERNTEQKI